MIVQSRVPEAAVCETSRYVSRKLSVDMASLDPVSVPQQVDLGCFRRTGY